LGIDDTPSRHERYALDVALSVIIPTWCEADAIAARVQHARGIGDEVIVVDGDSPDGTATRARAAGARVLRTAKGRGHQLRKGAAAARGDVLLFLHADTILEAGARDAIEAALADPAVVGGNFLLRFDPPDLWGRFFDTANDLRRRALAIYYGDSAIFVRRSVYDAIGGFRDQPLMEDFDLVKRMEAAGRTAYIRKVRAWSSARRFRDAPVKTLATWALVQGLYSAGVSAEALAKLYEDIR
jgi:rSAM/selenodomain-associated transferase 2